MRGVTIFIALLLISWSSVAQGDACSTLVQQAIDTTHSNCTVVGRNQACYGNVYIKATAQDDALDFVFEQTGDVENVAEMKSLQLSDMVTPDEWGIALMSVQANLPDTFPGQNVTILLFGDVAVNNDGVSAPQPVQLDIQISSGINVRSGPGTNFAVTSSLSSGDLVIANGRNDKGDWLQLQLADGVGWVFASLVTVEGDISTLDIVTGAESSDSPIPFGPMQAFTFQSGLGEPECNEAPHDGILIQTPLGAGKIILLINEVQILLGSTAYIRAIPDDRIVIGLLEGQANVFAQGTMVSVIPGTQAVIPADANAIADGTPTLEALDIDHITSLPLELLPRPINIPEPIGLLQPLTGRYLRPAIAPLTIACQGGLTMDSAVETFSVIPQDNGSALIINRANGGLDHVATLSEGGGYVTEPLGVLGYILTYRILSPTEIAVSINACGTIVPDVVMTRIG